MVPARHAPGPSPVSTATAKPPRRRLRPGGDGASAHGTCARYGHRCPLARARLRRCPATRGGACAGLRPGLLRQVVRKRAVLDAGDSPPVRHEGRFTDAPPGLAMELPRHASSTSPHAAARGVLASRWGMGLARVRARAGEAVTRGCRVDPVSFRGRRPVRPWLVVNPGGRAAAPWALWPQPSSENNFPAFSLRSAASSRDKFFSLPGSSLRCDRKRCSPPIPRRSDHNKDALARPWFTERRKHHG